MGAPSVVVPPAPTTASAPPPAAFRPAVLPAATSYPANVGAVPQTSGKAVASMVMALVNGAFFFMFFPLAIVAVIFGHVARTEIRNSGGRLKGEGLALTGLILGYGSLGLVLVIVLATMASLVPGGRIGSGGASETRALGALRTYLVATVTYDAQFAKGYPPSLAAMGPGDGSERAAGLIDRRLVSGERYGYRFTYTPLDHNADGYFEAFTLTADPSSFSVLNGRHFFVDQTGIIRVEKDYMATSDSQQLE
jgi:hypothetical protein